MTKTEAFLKEKGVSLHSVRATRLPHKYKNEELELIPLMEQFGEKCFIQGWKAANERVRYKEARLEEALKKFNK